LVFEYQIFAETTREKLVQAETVMVAYDYHTHQSIPVPDQWREKISAYEGIRFPKK